MVDASSVLQWRDERTVEISGVTFHLRVDERFRSRPEAFLLVKHRHMVERYAALLERLAPRRMVELGILEGGSVAFAALVAGPDRLLALDLKREPTEALEEFVDARGLRQRIRAHYGVDQADRARVRALVEDELGPGPLDLVVDDASHLLESTRASFEVLFPLLRPDGVFVIEDWSAGHHFDIKLRARLREDPRARAALEETLRGAPAPDRPLTVLLFELVLASAFRRDVVQEVVVIDDWAYAVRGPAALDPEAFALADLYGESGARLLPDRG